MKLEKFGTALMAVDGCGSTLMDAIDVPLKSENEQLKARLAAVEKTQTARRLRRHRVLRQSVQEKVK